MTMFEDVDQQKALRDLFESIKREDSVDIIKDRILDALPNLFPGLPENTKALDTVAENLARKIVKQGGGLMLLEGLKEEGSSIGKQLTMQLLGIKEFALLLNDKDIFTKMNELNKKLGNENLPQKDRDLLQNEVKELFKLIAKKVIKLEKSEGLRPEKMSPQEEATEADKLARTMYGLISFKSGLRAMVQQISPNIANFVDPSPEDPANQDPMSARAKPSLELLSPIAELQAQAEQSFAKIPNSVENSQFLQENAAHLQAQAQKTLSPAMGGPSK